MILMMTAEQDLQNTKSTQGIRLAETLAELASYLNVNVQAEDIIAGLPVSIEDFSSNYITLAMDRLGLAASAITSEDFKKETLPFAVFMNDGTIRIVIAIDDNQITLSHAKIPNGIETIANVDFQIAATKTIITIAETASSLQKRFIAPEPEGHWFWSKIFGQKSLIRDVVLGTLIANLLAVAVSLFALQVYDRVIPNQSISSLWVLFIGAILAVSVEAILKVMRSGLLDISGRLIEMEISASLFRKMLGMKLSKRPMPPSTMAYMMREFGSVREFFTTTSINSAADIPFVIIFLGLIFLIAGPVSLIILGAMLMIIVPSIFARRKMVQLSEEMMGGYSAVNQVLTESSYGQETIKTLRAENYYQKKWEDLILLNSSKTTAQRILSAKLTFSAQAVQQLAYLSAIVAGVYLVFAGELTVGAIIAISILSTRCLAPVTNLANTLVKWQQVKASLNGLEQIIDSEQEKSIHRHYVQASSLVGDYVLDRVTFSYDEEMAPVLDIEALSIKAGRTTAILGSNGAGKSTLLMLLSGLYDQSAGTITLDGLALDQIQPDDLRRHIGYLSQTEMLLTGTIRENLDPSGRNYSDEILFSSLRFAGMGKFIKSHPMGLDMKILDGGKGLSTGQKLSIGLARLFLQNPTIILLDEPTASFDQMLEQKVVRKLKTWLEGKTCVLTTHRNAVLDLADDIIVLQKGRVSLSGPAEDVVQKLTRNADAVSGQNQGIANVA